MKQNLKKLLLISILLALLIPITLAASDLSITSLKDSLYLTGGEVTIDEPVERDVIIAAGSVSIEAPITGNVIITAGETNINAAIQGDLTSASGKTIINSQIDGKTTLSGGLNAITADSILNGDLTVSGSELILDGIINGDVDLDVETIITSETTLINGNLETNQKILNDVVKGETTLTTEKSAPQKAISTIGNTALHIIILYIIGILTLLVFGSYSESVAQKMANSPFLSFGFGILFFILIPIAILILVFTVVGIPIAIFLAIATALTVFLSVVFTSLTFGHVILYKLLNWKVSNYLELLLGSIVFIILIKLPIIGPILAIYGVCAGLGAAILSLIWYSKKKGKVKHL